MPITCVKAKRTGSYLKAFDNESTDITPHLPPLGRSYIDTSMLMLNGSHDRANTSTIDSSRMFVRRARDFIDLKVLINQKFVCNWQLEPPVRHIDVVAVGLIAYDCHLMGRRCCLKVLTTLSLILMCFLHTCDCRMFARAVIRLPIFA